MRVLVTGGGGFLGRAVVRLCQARGWAVRTLARRDAPDLRAQGVEVLQGNINDGPVVHAAVDGCEGVIHTAAKAGVWGSRAAYYRANVFGTENVLFAVAKHGTPRLVYTSTPSVVHGGGDIAGADESLHYPAEHETHYPATKAIAEKMVLAANSATLSTVALRPHLIWGPGDNHLAPRILDRARRGRLAFVGDGTNLVDTTYIDNAAEAHLLALDRLSPGAPCAGKAYFITNGEPRPLRDIINGILAAAGLPPNHRAVSPALAKAVGAVLEGIYGLFQVEAEPPMTRFVASQLSTAHWYDIGAARRDLGYIPRVTIDEGMKRLAAAYREAPP